MKRTLSVVVALAAALTLIQLASPTPAAEAAIRIPSFANPFPFGGLSPRSPTFREINPAQPYSCSVEVERPFKLGPARSHAWIYGSAGLEGCYPAATNVITKVCAQRLTPRPGVKCTDEVFRPVVSTYYLDSPRIGLDANHHMVPGWYRIHARVMFVWRGRFYDITKDSEPRWFDWSTPQVGIS